MGDIDIWRSLLVVSFEKREKMRLRKQANQKKLAQRQTSRCSWALDANPSREHSHTHPVQLLNRFRARGAVILGLARFETASQSQKMRDGWKNLVQEQTNRWSWALNFIPSRECPYGCPVQLLNTSYTVRATTEPVFVFLLLFEHDFRPQCKFSENRFWHCFGATILNSWWKFILFTEHVLFVVSN